MKTQEGGKDKVVNYHQQVPDRVLEALKSLLLKYECKVKRIHIAPPYNTGNEGENLSRHDKWLCMMYPRLRLLQTPLSEYGEVFMNTGENESENLKLICAHEYVYNEIAAGRCSVVCSVPLKRRYRVYGDY